MVQCYKCDHFGNKDFGWCDHFGSRLPKLERKCAKFKKSKRARSYDYEPVIPQHRFAAERSERCATD